MTELAQVQEFLEKVNREVSGTYILAGGCIRDLVMDRIPKDYDAFLIGGDADDPYDYVAAHLAAALVRVGACRVQVHTTYRDMPAGRLAWVVKCEVPTTARPIPMDFIYYTSAPSSGAGQVAEFDSTLNMCYLDPDEGLVLLPEHPLITGVVQPLSSLDGGWPERREYLKEKFPQFTYSDEVLT